MKTKNLIVKIILMEKTLKSRIKIVKDLKKIIIKS